MSAPIGYSAPPLVSAGVAPEDDEVLALIEQQEQEQEAERKRLAAMAQQQQASATGLRRLGLVTGMGTNPLLQGFSSKLLGQAGALDGNAAQSASRARSGDRFGQQVALTRLRSSLRAPSTAAASLDNDPASEASHRIRTQVKSLYPDLPDEVLATITERNGQSFLTRREGRGRLDGQDADREQKGEQFATMMGYRWADLRQDERLALMRIAAAEGNKSDKTVSDLRKEFMGNKVVKDYLDGSIAFQKVENAAKDPSAAGDLALIFGVMKTFDPGSTVREGEFANAENAKGVPDSVRAKWNKILSGERLTPSQRTEFVRISRGQLEANKGAYDQLASGYAGLAPEGAASQVVLPVGKPSGLRRVAARPPQSKPASAVLPTDAAGGLTLDPPPSTSKVAPNAPSPSNAASRSPKDEAALKWARTNKADPRAAAILVRLGVSE